jgi:hypothetical protein
MAARTIHPNVQEVNANLPSANFPPILLSYLEIALACEVPVLPLDDRAHERFNLALAGRPDLLEGRTEMTVYEGMKGIPENGLISAKNRSFVVTAGHIEVPNAGAEGVVIAQRRVNGRLEPLCQGRCTQVRIQLFWSRDLQGRWPRSPAGRARDLLTKLLRHGRLPIATYGTSRLWAKLRMTSFRERWLCWF